MSDLPALYDGNTGEIMPLPTGLSGTSLMLPTDLTYDKWVGYARGLDRMAQAIMWWLGDWWRFGHRKWGAGAQDGAQAALGAGFPLQTCKDAGWVADKVEVSRRRDTLPWSHHKEVAALDPIDQEYFLARWVKHAEAHDGSPPPQKEARAEVGAFKRDRDRPQFDDPPPLSDKGPFDVLYVDPPWRYDYAPTDSRAIENQYPTMELDDICALEPPAADDVVLFLWATSPKLAESMAVLDAWKFDYRTCMVWVKDRIGMGYYARQQHELLLIAKRGEPPVPEPSARPSSVVTADRADHSVKPDVFYDLIEQMYPGRRYGEMFARRPRKGWGSWGNQS